jgi:CubicO group peptidase (beta-lactamase class C family)
MVLVYSATKGLAAMTLAIAHSRRWLDYDERIARYWPEFAQHGKERITVRQLLAHQAGLFAFDDPVDRNLVGDLDRLAPVLAGQRPAWEQGLDRPITPSRWASTKANCSAAWIRSTEVLDDSSKTRSRRLLARTSTFGCPRRSRTPVLPRLQPQVLSPCFSVFGPLRLMVDGMNRRSNIYRALVANPGFAIAHDAQRVYARNLEVPSGGGVGTARGIAHAYGVFASGGRDLGLRQQTLDWLAAPAVAAACGFHDECLKAEVQFSLGFMKPSSGWPFGSARSFGSPGSGGALGFADPAAGIGYGYVTSQLGAVLTGDPRDVALREALYAAL